MQIDQNQTNSGDVPGVDVDVESQELLDEMKRTSQEIETVNAEIGTSLDDIDRDVKDTEIVLEQSFSDLDLIEKETDNELDNLAMDQSEDLASEDSVDDAITVATN